MPDPTLSQAIREVYAAAPAGTVTLHTLEIRHPSFAAPIRVVRNYGDTATWTELGGAAAQAVLDAMDPEDRDKVGLIARLEADAPQDAGEMVAFVALAFDFDLPSVENIPLPEIGLTMDNVGREIADALDAAATSEDETTVTYRPFLSTDIEAPHMSPPLTMTLSDVEADPLRVTGKAHVLDVGNRALSYLYTTKRFPTLAQ